MMGEFECRPVASGWTRPLLPPRVVWRTRRLNCTSGVLELLQHDVD